jgi:hypothetical protein
MSYRSALRYLRSQGASLHQPLSLSARVFLLEYALSYLSYCMSPQKDLGLQRLCTDSHKNARTLIQRTHESLRKSNVGLFPCKSRPRCARSSVHPKARIIAVQGHSISSQPLEQYHFWQKDVRVELAANIQPCAESRTVTTTADHASVLMLPKWDGNQTGGSAPHIRQCSTTR